MNKSAAVYLRSSKDRSDVFIDAQRRELKALAKSKGLKVAAEYSDAVYSGKDEDRPGFQQLISAVRDRQRGWYTLLVLDTSRIARRRHIAVVFEHDAQKHGVQVVYKSIPDTDNPMADMLLKSIMQAMDEYHSMTSKAKGLAGMAENVRKGFRAGGRAPTGYKLVSVETDAMRDGKPVMKSRLEADAKAKAVQKYLKARAAGKPRSAVRDLLGMSDSALVGLEWQALMYAGYTVWGVHAERTENGYAGGRKRKPRNEWVISPEQTHEALITPEEAESILDKLENSAIGKRVSEGKRAVSAPLLTGYLKSSDGRQWTADRKYYKLDGAYLKQQDVDDLILETIFKDLMHPVSIKTIVKRMREDAKKQIDTRPLERQITMKEKQIDSTLELATELNDPAPVLRRVKALEIERNELLGELADLRKQKADRKLFASINAATVLEGVFDTLSNCEPSQLLETCVQEIQLKPDMTGSIIYRLSMASPRGFEPLLPP